MNMLQRTEIDQKILQAMTKHKVVGLSAAVVKDNQVVWSNAYGWANLEKEIPVTQDTFFRVASISKTIIATALMQQYEQGKFQLDDDISECLGYMVRNPTYPEHKITYKQILTHTSSLQCDEEVEGVYVSFANISQSDQPPSLKELLVLGGAYYSENAWENYKPGDSYGYSNLGSIVLGTLLEKLSGQRVDIYCKEHIFKPLGMKQTSFNLEDFSDINNLGVLYNYIPADGKFTPGTDNLQGVKPKPLDLRNYVAGTNAAVFRPQGGLRTNASDLSTFMLAHMNSGEYKGSRILKQETADLMGQVQWTGEHRGVMKKVGIQFQIREDLIPEKEMLGHSGEAYGLLSDMYFNKREKFGMVLITNGSDYQLGKHPMFFDVEESFLDLFYKDIIHTSTNKTV